MEMQLTNQERIELKEQLTTLAQWYFDHDERLSTNCGICHALSQMIYNDIDNRAYAKIQALLLEAIGSEHLGVYVDKYEEWEDRAYMCLFLAAYLEGTIEMKSSDILRKAKETMWDGVTLYDPFYDDIPSNYICDNVMQVIYE